MTCGAKLINVMRFIEKRGETSEASKAEDTKPKTIIKLQHDIKDFSHGFCAQNTTLLCQPML